MRGMSSIGKVVSETPLEDYKPLAQIAKKQVCDGGTILPLGKGSRVF